VSLGDGSDYGEPKAESLVLAGALWSEALKRLQEPADLVAGHRWSRVGHLEACPPRPRTDGDVYPALRAVVADRVLSQIRDKSLDEANVARDGASLKCRADGQSPGARVLAERSHDARGDGRQVEDLPVAGFLLAAGQDEQGFDEPGLLLVAREDSLTG
jgi:hypothetical protein